MPNPQNHSSDKNIDPALAETVPQMATAVTMPIEEIKTIWSGVKETQTLEQTINMTQQMSDIGTRTIKKQTGPATIGVQVTQKFVANQRDAAGAIPAFEISQVLGQGGMGVVYEARQTSIDRLIAFKMIRSDRDANNQAREKFLAEAVVTGDLDHPNIISVHDLGET